MATTAQIESFLAPRKLAIVGASRNPKKFGRVVYEDLKGKGFTVWAVNPHAEKLDADPCYPDITSLPPEVDRVFIVTPPEKTAENVKQAMDKGIRNIWIQQRSDTAEALELLKGSDVNLIHNECIFMFAGPVKGAHKFHRFINKLFGKYPK
jgi:predicted CoA-binding protein